MHIFSLDSIKKKTILKLVLMDILNRFLYKGYSYFDNVQ